MALRFAFFFILLSVTTRLHQREFVKVNLQFLSVDSWTFHHLLISRNSYGPCSVLSEDLPLYLISSRILEFLLT